MKVQSISFLQNLVESIGPSGYEEQTAAIWRKEANTFADEVTTDVHGNVHATVNPGGSPTIMIAGHLDEIGFQISHIDEDGYLYFTTIGGWDAQIPQGQRVWIRTEEDRISGVIGKKAVHLKKKEEKDQVQQFRDMWIDIGAEAGEEAKELVSIGDPVVLAWGFEQLQNGYLVSKSFDNRVGAFTALETARNLQEQQPSAEVVAVGTVQEEIGLRGAKTATHNINPDLGIAIDVTHATDYPNMESDVGQMGEVQLGEGPVIYRGPNVNSNLYDLLVETAENQDLPHQIRAYPKGTGTDGNAMQIARSGVATAVVSVPNRYMHTPCEVVHRNDLDSLVNVLSSTLIRAESREQFIPSTA